MKRDATSPANPYKTADSSRRPLDATKSSYGHFRRYTNLAATIHLLSTKQITLLNPATWDDKNDSYFMAEFKRLKNAKSVLALCFAEREETYHHWRVFSNGGDGVCIEFEKQKLLSTFATDDGIRVRTVDYTLIKDLKKRTNLRFEDLPFLKRFPYTDEREFRIVYVSCTDAFEYRDYPIKIGWIKRVTLSPWMPKALAASVKTTLRSIPDCSSLRVSQSTLIENDQWKKVTSRLPTELLMD
jgi:hypothetical protein